MHSVFSGSAVRFHVRPLRYDRPGRHGSKRSEEFDSRAAGFPIFLCCNKNERLTDFSQHLEEVGQSSLLLLQDVLHLRLLLLFLRRRVHVEALQVPQAADDLA